MHKTELTYLAVSASSLAAGVNCKKA